MRKRSIQRHVWKRLIVILYRMNHARSRDKSEGNGFKSHDDFRVFVSTTVLVSDQQLLKCIEVHS